MKKKCLVPLKDALTGTLTGGAGIFRILIDEETAGAKHFSMLLNTMNAGAKGKEHKHEVEHCWYILSGRGTMNINGESFEIGPEMAVYTPANVLHKIDVGFQDDLTYVLIYAPPGPEQELKQLGEEAFGTK